MWEVLWGQKVFFRWAHVHRGKALKHLMVDCGYFYFGFESASNKNLDNGRTHWAGNYQRPNTTRKWVMKQELHDQPDQLVFHWFTHKHVGTIAKNQPKIKRWGRNCSWPSESAIRILITSGHSHQSLNHKTWNTIKSQLHHKLSQNIMMDNTLAHYITSHIVTLHQTVLRLVKPFYLL